MLNFVVRSGELRDGGEGAGRGGGEERGAGLMMQMRAMRVCFCFLLATNETSWNTITDIIKNNHHRVGTAENM